MIFVLLLIFLVLSVLFSRWAMCDVDGFIGYNYEKDVAEAVIIPMYSTTNKLYKMYDSLYFDNKNGNIIEVDATAYSNVGGVSAGNLDLTGRSITGLHISPRVGNSTMSYVLDGITSVITPSPSTNIEKSYRSTVYRTLGNLPTRYTAFMLPWHDNTYVHIMNNSTSPVENVSTFGFTYETTAIPYEYANKAAMTGITVVREDKNLKNNTMVIDPIYNTKRSMYQISEYVKYDISNANILVGSGEKALNIYSRQGTAPQTLTMTASDQETKNGDDLTNVANITFIPRIIYDLCGQNMILYVPNAKKTLVALICYTRDEQSNLQLGLRNVCRFTESGIDTGGPNSVSTSTGTTTGTTSGTGTTYADFDLADYMLKTQVVPPVCPACPSCNYNNGACNQCGGNGGCGTRTNAGDSLVTGGIGIRDALTATGNAAGDAVNAVGTAATGAVNAAGNVATGAVNAAGNVATGAVNAVGNAATGAVNATGNVAGEAVNATGNVAGRAVDATGNVAGRAVDATGNVAGRAVDATGNVAGRAVDAAGNVVNRTVDTAGNIATGVLGAASNVASGAFGAASNVASGAFGAVSNIATGAMGAAGNVATGAIGTVGNVLGSANNRMQQGQVYPGTTSGAMQQGPVSQGTTSGAMQQQTGPPQPSVAGATSTSDPYSYYGQLPAKNNNNFMPITADFSSFGR